MAGAGMYAVIFRAKSGIQDSEYATTVGRLRELAFERYGCREFVAVTEGDQEIAISYWENEAAILHWKQDSEHQLAQELGRAKWYESYTVQVVEIKREYSFSS
jgi:heme-degrading monooxygenase HmoA